MVPGVERITVPADQALFEGKVDGLVIAFHENERPLWGLAGLMDWRFQGAVSRHLRRGEITGKPGECVYLPVSRNGITYHLIFVGGGFSSQPGRRTSLPAESLRSLRKNLASLKIQKLGASKSDFGDVSEDYFSDHLKGIPIWTLP